MASFPTMQSGSIATDGTMQQLRRNIAVVTFDNGSEQRWRARRELFEVELVFRGISGYDQGTIMEFFNSNKGRFDDTWDITIETVLYENMNFASDTITWTYAGNGRFDGRIRCIQTKKN